MTTPSDSVASHLPPLARLCLGLLGLFAFVLVLRLWPEWQDNPDLSHGLFMPFLFMVMVHESRTAGTRRYLRHGPLTRTVFGSQVALALIVLSTAGLYAAALGWSHTLVEFLLIAAFVLLLGAGLVVFSDARVRLIPFNWGAVAAIGLWLLSAPIPPGTYTRLTLQLQLWVTHSVLSTLHLLGIAAYRTGNIIELARGSVGVAEACSGVRSLISCVFAALFFSATLTRRPRSRLILIALAAPLALGMNFLRSLILTLLANSGVGVVGRWHDITGYSVLALTTLILGALALRLDRCPLPSTAPQTTPPQTAPVSFPKSKFFLPLSSALLVTLALAGLFVLNTRSTPRPTAPVPDLFSLLPSDAPGWSVDTNRDLYQFSDTLQTRHLAQRTYSGRNAAGAPIQITLYLAYWPAGQSTVSRVAAHTPDACWPGSGWVPQTTPTSRVSPTLAEHTLPPAEYRFFKNNGFPQHLWFWHLYDGHPIAYKNPYSARELFALAWRFGFRREGDQLFVRVSGSGPWTDLAPAPFLPEFFAHLRVLGLQ